MKTERLNVRLAKLLFVWAVACACTAATPPSTTTIETLPVAARGAGGAGDSQLTTSTVEIAPSMDNTLIETPDGSLSNGSGPGLFVGRTGQGPGHSLRRALLLFDLTDSIPRGARILDATLKLPFAMGCNLTMSLHRITRRWGEGASSSTGGRGAPSAEGDATWIHSRFDKARWETPGGDFEAQPSAEHTLTCTGAIAFESTDTMRADVQDWLDRPAENFGWILVGSEGIARLGSREALEEVNRPRLIVTYSPAN